MPTRTRGRRRLKRLLLATIGLPLPAVLLFFVASAIWPFPLERIDRWPAGPQVTDRTDRQMLAAVGRDGQWHFRVDVQDISPWLVQATIAVEDERFYSHPGVDPLAVTRAAWQNLFAGRIVSGGSTLTMQVCRMINDRPRTWRAKIAETFRSLQLERLRDKQSILETYLNIAPYGRNLRGAQAAAWAWFNKPAAELSLAEAAVLAGLPQSPSRHRPDRYPARAQARRSTVLRRMAELGMITEQQRRTADTEPIHLVPRPRQIVAPHAAWLAVRHRPLGGRTTIDLRLQGQVEHLVAQHARALPAPFDLAVVVVDIATGEILSLVGSADFADPVKGQVNGAAASRSPGSALKPFLYAAAFEARRLAPDSILHDVPITRAGWSPENFDRTFRGPVTAAEALQRSLNVPAILVAEAVGLPRCAGVLEAVGLGLPKGTLSRGGLAIVTGSIETRLLDLTNAYATIGRGGTWQQPRLFLDDPVQTRCALDPNICATLDEILSSRQRRPAGMHTTAAGDVPWFMWKTGTSSGRRDAWAVGHNRRVAIGVWAGRFSGTGSPCLTGAAIAEPLLARLFNLPGLRTTEAPPAAQPWIVSNPIPPPAEVAQRLAILSPRDGSTFAAISGRALIHPKINHPADATWFLNGRRLQPDAAIRLSLPPGRYELRCVTTASEVNDGPGIGPLASAVRFVVR
jgi:penicillin-binding protein 1C